MAAVKGVSSSLKFHDGTACLCHGCLRMTIKGFYHKSNFAEIVTSVLGGRC